jgi:hypothetical protein
MHLLIVLILSVDVEGWCVIGACTLCKRTRLFSNSRSSNENKLFSIAPAPRWKGKHGLENTRRTRETPLVCDSCGQQHHVFLRRIIKERGLLHHKYYSKNKLFINKTNQSINLYRYNVYKYWKLLLLYTAISLTSIVKNGPNRHLENSPSCNQNQMNNQKDFHKYQSLTFIYINYH